MYIDHTNPDLYQKNSNIKNDTPTKKDKNKDKKRKEITLFKNIKLFDKSKIEKKKKSKSSELNIESIDFSINSALSTQELTQESFEEEKEAKKGFLNSLKDKKTQDSKEQEKKSKTLTLFKKKKEQTTKDITKNKNKKTLNPFISLKKSKEKKSVEQKESKKEIVKNSLDNRVQSQVLLKYQELLKNSNKNLNNNVHSEPTEPQEEYSYIKEDKKESFKKSILNKYKDTIESIKKSKRIKTKTQKIKPISPNKAITRDFLAFEFKGSAKEYFKIWIVNVLLSLVTLGIYSAWAKVRGNQYLYANTFLNGANFAYNADPKRILYGRVIVVSFYALFFVFSDILNMYDVALGIFALFILLLPWLIRQAIRFKLRSASYRNIKFNFKAKISSFYYLGFLFILPYLLMIAIPFGLKSVETNAFIPVIYLPIIFIVGTFLIFILYYSGLYHKYKTLVINNSYYGLEKFNFSGTKKEAIVIFLKIGLYAILFTILLALIAVGGKYLIHDILNIKLYKMLNSNLLFILTYFVGAMFYLAFLGFFRGLVDAYLSNYVRNNTSINGGVFKGTIEPLKLAFIGATNYVMLLFTLGLLYPYTKLRYLRYKIENTHFACDDYSKFNASRNYKVNTIGEEAVDFFDIDIGI